MVVSVNAEKEFDKTQHQDIIKAPRTLDIEGNVLNLIQSILKHEKRHHMARS
jgi:hypothetical protein